MPAANDVAKMPYDSTALQVTARPQPVNSAFWSAVKYIHGGPVLPAVQDYLVLSASAKDGVKIGDEFMLFQPRKAAEDAALLAEPEVPIARGQVVRVTPYAATILLTAEKHPTIAGRVVQFPANLGPGEATLRIYRLWGPTGHRIGHPVATFHFDASENTGDQGDGAWGPVRVWPGQHYELEIKRPGQPITGHYYKEPFTRSNHFVRFLLLPDVALGPPITEIGPNHSAIVALRYKEWWAGRPLTPNDSLRVGTDRPGFRRDVPDLMRAVDVMCLPSHREPFGLVYIEAALAQKPVIACDAGGAPEIIAHNETGLLVPPPPENVTPLADAIFTLLDNRERAAEMGRRGREAALDRFGWPKYLARLREVYDRVRG